MCAKRIIWSLLIAYCSASCSEKDDYSYKNENTTFSLPKLPYSYNALEPVLWTQVIYYHHKKEHKNIINELNDYIKNNQDFAGQTVTDLLINYGLQDDGIANYAGGHYNHCLLWWIYTLADCTKEEPEGKLLTKIEEKWGNFTDFVGEFTKTANSVFGSGWVWLCADSEGNLEIKAKKNEYSPLAGGECYPILGIDLWEHAYYLKFLWERKEYVSMWWTIVDWELIEYWYETYAANGLPVPV
ncbi:unnamed protein product [Blepharisma stoltei]|uniref:Superoxide dismutase n=1 Tax=Blepharisma stoltei TaxID=1481888 RepID=A0AAU9JR69_9CILI|nr:unnamed protein product [Blepharisma stoltei]